MCELTILNATTCLTSTMDPEASTVSDSTLASGQADCKSTSMGTGEDTSSASSGTPADPEIVDSTDDCPSQLTFASDNFRQQLRDERAAAVIMQSKTEGVEGDIVASPAPQLRAETPADHSQIIANDERAVASSASSVDKGAAARVSWRSYHRASWRSTGSGSVKRSSSSASGKGLRLPPQKVSTVRGRTASPPRLPLNLLGASGQRGPESEVLPEHDETVELDSVDSSSVLVSSVRSTHAEHKRGKNRTQRKAVWEQERFETEDGPKMPGAYFVSRVSKGIEGEEYSDEDSECPSLPSSESGIHATIVSAQLVDADQIRQEYFDQLNLELAKNQSAIQSKKGDDSSQGFCILCGINFARRGQVLFVATVLLVAIGIAILIVLTSGGSAGNLRGAAGVTSSKTSSFSPTTSPTWISTTPLENAQPTPAPTVATSSVAPSTSSPSDPKSQPSMLPTMEPSSGPQSTSSPSHPISQPSSSPTNTVQPTAMAWRQVGGDIDGERMGDQSGRSIALSSNGNVIAVGATRNNGNGRNNSNAGHVRVFEISQADQWVQRGADIDGNFVDGTSGWSVTLSGNGAVVAIGAPNDKVNGRAVGRVRVHRWTGAAWVQLGRDVTGGPNSARFGQSVALSRDGTVLAVGDNRHGGNGRNAGAVQVFDLVGRQWVARGQPLNRSSAGDQFGFSIDLSANGSVVAVGSPFSNANGSMSGATAVYKWTGTAWTQRGNDIPGQAPDDQFGYSVSLSRDGSVVAIGAWLNTNNNGNTAGSCRVFSYNGTSWNQKGEAILGESHSDRSGRSVALSDSGNSLVVGAIRNDGNGVDSGHARVFRYSGTYGWTQQGSDIDGEAAGDRFGFQVALSGDGSRVAAGAPFNRGNGFDSGHVRVYQWG